MSGDANEALPARRWRVALPLHPFRPRLVDCLKDYDRATLGADVGAGITVGVVALPLAMAFAIGSGVKPEAGLFTAIIAGFLISLLGGSRVPGVAASSGGDLGYISSRARNPNRK